MNALADTLAFATSAMLALGVLVVGFAFLTASFLSRSTRQAIQYAVWHRIICGSPPKARSIGRIIGILILGLVLLYVTMLVISG